MTLVFSHSNRFLASNISSFTRSQRKIQLIQARIKFEEFPHDTSYLGWQTVVYLFEFSDSVEGVWFIEFLELLKALISHSQK